MTQKQELIIRLFISEESFEDSSDEDVLSIDEIIQKLSYKPTKQAVQFSLRALRKRGYLEKRDSLVLREGKQRVIWHLTDSARKLFCKSRPVSV